MSRFKIFGTSYWSGGFRYHANSTLFGSPMTESAWTTEWVLRATSDPEALLDTIRDYLIGPAADLNIERILSYHASIKTVAESWGASSA